MTQSAYDLSVSLPGTPFDQALDTVKQALAEQGFGVLTEIDVKSTFRKKLNVDFRRYQILGACNPQLAHKALTIDADVGLLLPCNVVVQEEGQGSRISVVDPRAMFSLVERPEIEPVVGEARERLQRVLDSLR